MPRAALTAALMLVGASLQVAAEDAHRQLGAHEHGHATLNVAIEGNRLTMELLAPGMDIVGFEHAAANDADRAALSKATALLAEPSGLFKLPASAACKASPAKVAVEADHDHDDDHAHGGKDAHPSAAAHDGHAQFHAQYAFNCQKAVNLSRIEFPYFQRFPASRALDVNVIGPKGQTRFEISRDKPIIDLGGIM